MKFYTERIGRNKIYRCHFSSLTDLSDYLKSNPPINSTIFPNPASMTSEDSFHGKDLSTSINYCLGGYKNEFSKFKIMTNEVMKSGYEDMDSRKLVKSIYGGIAVPALVASGIPECMLSYSHDQDVKYVSIYFQLGYPHQTTKSQIFNRGIATINLIQALQDKGYIVDLKAFKLSKSHNEIVDISIDLKKVSELLSISKCYYPFVGREFLRRVLFRVLESVPVQDDDWTSGYGQPLDSYMISDIYKLKEKDLIISYPSDMGIYGLDVYGDTANLFETLNLDEDFNTDKIRQKGKILEKRY